MSCMSTRPADRDSSIRCPAPHILRSSCPSTSSSSSSCTSISGCHFYPPSSSIDERSLRLSGAVRRVSSNGGLTNRLILPWEAAQGHLRGGRGKWRGSEDRTRREEDLVEKDICGGGGGRGERGGSNGNRNSSNSPRSVITGGVNIDGNCYSCNSESAQENMETRHLGSSSCEEGLKQGLLLSTRVQEGIGRSGHTKSLKSSSSNSSGSSSDSSQRVLVEAQGGGEGRGSSLCRRGRLSICESSELTSTRQQLNGRQEEHFVWRNFIQEKMFREVAGGLVHEALLEGYEDVAYEGVSDVEALTFPIPDRRVLLLSEYLRSPPSSPSSYKVIHASSSSSSSMSLSTIISTTSRQRSAPSFTSVASSFTCSSSRSSSPSSNISIGSSAEGPSFPPVFLSSAPVSVSPGSLPPQSFGHPGSTPSPATRPSLARAPFLGASLYPSPPIDPSVDPSVDLCRDPPVDLCRDPPVDLCRDPPVDQSLGSSVSLSLPSEGASDDIRSFISGVADLLSKGERGEVQTEERDDSNTAHHDQDGGDQDDNGKDGEGKEEESEEEEDGAGEEEGKEREGAGSREKQERGGEVEELRKRRGDSVDEADELGPDEMVLEEVDGDEEEEEEEGFVEPRSVAGDSVSTSSSVESCKTTIASDVPTAYSTNEGLQTRGDEGEVRSGGSGGDSSQQQREVDSTGTTGVEEEEELHIGTGSLPLYGGGFGRKGNEEMPLFVDPRTRVDCSAVHNLSEGLLSHTTADSFSEYQMLSRMLLGRWETLLSRSGPLDPLFKNFGIAYIKRIIVDRLAVPLTVTLEEEEEVLHVVVHLPVGNRHMRWLLDGSSSFEEDPDCGTWEGSIRCINLSLPWVCGGRSFRSLQQVRSHQKIGVVHETRAVLPDDKHGRILFLNYTLYPKNCHSNKVDVVRILKPIV